MRFYCESIQDTSILNPIESGHLCRVLRAQQGTAVELFDGKGTLGRGVVEKADKKKSVVRVTALTTQAPTAERVILAVSMAKGERFDWLVEKCTELGVDHIAAVQFDRTVKLGKKSALERFEKIAVSAAKQSERLFLPTFSGPERLTETLNSLNKNYPNSCVFYGDPKGAVLHDVLAVQKGRDTIIVIGPEGGFSDEEYALFAAHQLPGVLIHQNILRIETAAVAFCAAVAAIRL